MSTKLTRTKGHQLTHAMELVTQVTAKVTDTQTMLRQINMVNNFANVVQQHSVTAPVIETMRSVPDFEQAAKNFPASELYNNVPTHRSDERYGAALESLGEATSTSLNGLVSASQALAQSVADLVTQAAPIAVVLKDQIKRDRDMLEQSDISDDEIAILQTVSIQEESFNALFTALESYFESAAPFNNDHLRANPEQLSQDLEGLGGIVAEVGPVLGLTLTPTGLSESAKDERYIPTQGFYEEKGLNKANLIFQLDRADALCDMLMAMSEKQSELNDAIATEALEIPEVLDSDDVHYGANDHVALMGCYATMMAKAVKETMVLTSNLLTAVDGITDAIEEGEAALAMPEADEPEVAE